MSAPSNKSETSKQARLPKLCLQAVSSYQLYKDDAKDPNHPCPAVPDLCILSEPDVVSRQLRLLPRGLDL
jgi:hypothetical protein